ncbi:Profilin-2 [Porphyridium purpureum]|uniref:Profilin n=1 Tax=Porphyridium purpureum TaxID=35688 RepID=A0A5J4YIH8_PORPP|nr:Profilin-2 [Porphyridium purpureum]|eukprot:POR6108..scf251_18
MSWQTYVDQNLLGAGFCYAAIVGHDGSTWAASPGYTVLPDEAARLAQLLGGDADTINTQLSSGGFKVAGQQYAFTRAEVDDDDGGVPTLQGRCKEEGKSAQGIIIYRTAQALIIGCHDPAYSNGASFNKANMEMGKVADYMFENSF